MRAEDVVATLLAERLVGIVRAASAAAAARDLAALRAVGVAVAEVSLTTPGALDVIAAAAQALEPGQVLGAGTVLDAAAVRAAVAAGARLIIAPSLSSDVVRTARDLDVAVVPGCATPTEMLEALRLGAHAVKLFPADSWSPQALGTMLRALPQVRVVPTGGVTLQTAPRWLEAGAVAVGIGAALTSTEQADDVRRAVAGLRRR